MGAATVVTLIGVFVAVAAVALYLIIIAYTLNKVSFTVGTVLIGVRAIASQCEPLKGVVGDIVADVTAVEQAMGRLVAEGDRLALGAAQPRPRRLRGARR
ncbi:MAG: perilipin family protein [Actinomycetota bacterium]|nr:perilipin family protein [Actinomycetota bacterium]